MFRTTQKYRTKDWQDDQNEREDHMNGGGRDDHNHNYADRHDHKHGQGGDDNDHMNGGGRDHHNYADRHDHKQGQGRDNHNNGRDDHKNAWGRDDHKNDNRHDTKNGRDDHKNAWGRDDHKHHKGRDDHKNDKDRDNNDLARGDQKVLEKIFGKDAVKDADQFFASSFLALNDSKVSGAALMMFDEESNQLSVAVSAHGLTPNEVHIQHIHGFTGANPMNASVPDNDQDDDRDGFVEIAEGLETYGPVLLNFTPFPRADANGDVFFVNTFTLPSTPPAGRPLEFLDIPPDLTLREIVLHGLTIPAGFGVGTPGEVNGTGGYLPALPVASNEIVDLNSKDGNLAITEFRNEVKDWAFA